jgi:hypothetical protein
VDFSHYFQPFEGLEEMSRPFTHDEIDKVIAHMLGDKATGPHGFSGLFS